MKRFLVTGGAGVIGQEIVPKLIDRGYLVWVGDLKPKPIAFDDSVIYRQGDLNTLTATEMMAFEPDVIIHLAATFERTAETSGFWSENFLHNVTLSHHIMTIARQVNSLKRVIFASSYLIYQPDLYQFDTPPDTPISLKETDPILPRNLTGMAKLSHEIELRFLSNQEETKFSIACVRIFRGYGRHSRDVISRWVRALLSGEKIEVYNSAGVFDYLYARDSAEGLIQVSEAPDVTGIINLGTSKARKVRDVIDVLKKHFPNMEIIDHGNTLPIESSQADMERWNSLIGWKPEFTLERAIPEIINYERALLDAGQPQTTSSKSVLITSAASKVPLIKAVKAAIMKLGAPDVLCWAGDVDPGVLAKHIADKFWLLPKLTNIVLDEFIQGCKERNIGIIIPTRDGELEYWAEHKEALRKNGIQVLVSPLDSVKRCLNKLEFANFGCDTDMPFIPAHNTLDIPANKNLVHQTYTVKEQFGAGSKSIGLNLNKEDALTHAASLSNPIFQPYINGRELSVDAWMDIEGNPKGLIMRWRDKVVNGESQITTTFSDPDMELIFMKILKSLDLRGPAVLQAIIDEEKRIHVIECNCRFGGASTLSIASGLDSFYWSLLEAQNADLSDILFIRIPGELRQIRVPNDEYIDDTGI